jgi:hypothetical protein
MRPRGRPPEHGVGRQLACVQTIMASNQSLTALAERRAYCDAQHRANNHHPGMVWS